MSETASHEDRPETLEAYAAYLSAQRWCGADADARVTGVRGLSWLSDPAEGLGVRVELVHVEAHDGAHVYQLPVAVRPEPAETLGHALVAAHAGEDGSTSYVYDALHDHEARSLLVRGFGAEPGPTPPDLAYARHGEAVVSPDDETVLLTGEQSNTSVVVGHEAVLKVFRRLHPGRNPDIEVHEAISADGGDSVAVILGSMRTAGLADDPEDEYDLAMLQRFLRTATGGWDSARASLRDLVNDPDLAPDEAGGDFAADAHRLGLTTAHVHQLLAEHLPTGTWQPADVGRLADRLEERLVAAVAAAPALEPFVDGVRARYAQLREVDADVRVQRVHGDLHLGQTLRTTAGWKIIDFEGEPSQPVTDRVRLDCPVRDVAGMLRSLDYAARSVLIQVGIESEAVHERASAWLARNRDAFLEGYGFGSDEVPRRLLAAYELDKAVYEVVYEVRYRPTWVDIPLRAVASLTA